MDRNNLEKYLIDPEIFSINKLPAHSDHKFFLGNDSNGDNNRDNNKFTKSLNGDWKFSYAANPSLRVKDFYMTDFDSSNFDTIKVPGQK